MSTDKASNRAGRRRTIDIISSDFKGFAESIGRVSTLLILLAAAYLFFGTIVGSDRDLYVALVVGFAAVVLVLRLLPPLRRQLWRRLAIETVAMTLFVTGISALTGGSTSTMTNLYLLPLIVASVVLGRVLTIVVLTLVFAALATLVLIDHGWSLAGLSAFGDVLVRFAPVLLVTYLTTLLAENIRSTRRQVLSMSEKDDLTELYNMRAFTNKLDSVHLAAVRHEQVYGIVMIDVDNLKPINDDFGHDAGNRAIVLVGNAIRRCIRSSDIAARYGGDEFILLLPHSSRESCEQAVRRIRNSVFSTTLKVRSKMVRISVSTGLACFPDDGADPAALLVAADKEMYRDKEYRRNRDAGRGKLAEVSSR